MNELILFVIAAAGGVLLFVLAVRWLRMHVRIETIHPWNKGLLYVNGRYRRTLEPGRHRLFHLLDRLEVFTVLTRPQQLTSGLINVASGDRLQFRLAASVFYEVADARVFHERDSLPLLRDAIEQALTAMAVEKPLTEFLDSRPTADQALADALAGVVPEIRVVSARISTVQLPPEVRRMFAEVEKAKFEGLAALERARGEQAALRSLANAARLLKDNPELKSLRLLQSVSAAGKGATIVLGHDAILANGSGTRLTES